jgi:arylsulfatase A-like enzyme
MRRRHDNAPAGSRPCVLKRRVRFQCFVASAAALWIGVHATACSRSSASSPNILLVVVDTLRADRLGVYGSRLGLTPFLDSLAERSWVFHRAYAQSSWTSPSIASLLTSRYQSQHGIVTLRSVLGDDERTLPEVLGEHGYATAAVSANILLGPKFGFAQGYDHYRLLAHPRAPGEAEERVKPRAEQVERAALSWLGGKSDDGPPRRPAFLYLHYMEPHNPYHPPEDVLAEILARRDHARPDVAAVNHAMAVSNVMRFEDDRVQATEDLYDAEVATLDRDLRKLFVLGFLDEAVVAVTADHGEELDEHGWMGHRKTLYEEVIHVPLLLHLPGQRARMDVHIPVPLVDVAPTLLALAGIASPPRFEGRSLLRGEAAPASSWLMRLRNLWSDPPANDREPVLTELIKPEDARRQSPHERAVIVENGKLIAGVDGEREYYDLARDPGETNPEGLDEATRARLEEALRALRRDEAGRPREEQDPDAETKERMRALGYGD